VGDKAGAQQIRGNAIPCVMKQQLGNVFAPVRIREWVSRSRHKDETMVVSHDDEISIVVEVVDKQVRPPLEWLQRSRIDASVPVVLQITTHVSVVVSPSHDVTQGNQERLPCTARPPSSNSPEAP